MIASLSEVVRVFNAAGVRFVVIGGWAGLIHGSARSTNDVDFVYARDDENLARVIAALAPHQPYLRGVPLGLPFRWDVQTLRSGLNFTLTTAIGDIDLLGEVAGGGIYENVISQTLEVEAFGVSCRVVTLELLIQLKRAAGRPKDFEAIAELQLLLDEQRKLDAET